jgi:hypothetical protein
MPRRGWPARDGDSGNLKGFLRKAGRKFNQDGVVWNGYYRDVLLFALKDLPGLGTADGDVQNFGPVPSASHRPLSWADDESRFGHRTLE